MLRDQGISYGDYIEQITYLLFLKMDQEREELLGETSAIPPQWSWAHLASNDGDELELQYRHTLESLGREDGLIGTIFRKAQNKLSDPAKLKRVISLIDKEGPWIGLQVDVKGEIYEGLLERNASEVKSGARQYFTPRPVINAIVKCVDPKIGDTVCDPACGTGGFLLAAYNHMKTLTQDRERLRSLRHRLVWFLKADGGSEYGILGSGRLPPAPFGAYMGIVPNLGDKLFVGHGRAPSDFLILKPFQKPARCNDHDLQPEHGVMLGRYAGMRSIRVQKLRQARQECLTMPVAELVLVAR